MKIYFNENLNIKQTSKMLSSLTKLDLMDEDFVKMEKLNTKKSIDEFIGKLKNEKKVFIYDYPSLSLTLMEFKKLDLALRENGIQLIFLDEGVNFYANLTRIIQSEHQLISNRVTESIGIAQERGSIIGRPKIQENKRERISYLYHEKNMPMRRIAEECNVSLGTVHKYAKQRSKR